MGRAEKEGQGQQVGRDEGEGSSGHAPGLMGLIDHVWASDFCFNLFAHVIQKKNKELALLDGNI